MNPADIIKEYRLTVAERLLLTKMLLHLSKNMHRNSVKKNTEMMLNPGN